MQLNRKLHLPERVALGVIIGLFVAAAASLVVLLVVA